MKKILFYFIAFLFCLSAKGQVVKKKSISGSWINTAVADYYESIKDSTCSVFQLNHRRLVPLYLSFDDKNQVKITFRIEQNIATYNITESARSFVVIAFGKKHQKIYLKNGLLNLQIEGNIINEGYLISFKKVSDQYSNDVFGEFIKGIIFEKNKTYTIATLNESNSCNNKVINRNNFQAVLKEVFKCDGIDIANLASFKFGKYCLPELAIYNNNQGNQWTNPRILGIQTRKDYVKFIDSTGVSVLTLNAN